MVWLIIMWPSLVGGKFFDRSKLNPKSIIFHENPTPLKSPLPHRDFFALRWGFEGFGVIFANVELFLEYTSVPITPFPSRVRGRDKKSFVPQSLPLLEVISLFLPYHMKTLIL